MGVFADDEEKPLKAEKNESLLEMLVGLREAYGWKLLGMLAFSQWMCKGMIWGFCLSAMDFLFRDYAVSGPRLQVYKAIVMLPWAMKPLFGLVSDAVPIFGYQKAPYMIGVSVVAVIAHISIGFSPEGSLPIKVVVLCLLMGCMQISVIDLLTEAKYAERIRQRPERGPDLMTYVWAGITLGNLCATASVGFILEHFGAHWVYAIVAIPAAIVIVPTWLNWLQEPKLTPDQVAKRQADMMEQKEVLFLVFLTGGATLALVAVGLMQDSVWVNLMVAGGAAVVVVTAFTMLLHPMIGKMNCFFFIQTCCVIDISGASFYFFTDTAVQFPEGPHFSKMFFASGLGVFIALLNLVGMSIYNKHMQHWRYHGLFIFANSLVCIVNIASMLVYTRFNVTLGIPDTFFVMSTWGVWAIVHMWMWLPGVVLLSQLCPKGVEATMYALLAGCHNLGLATASYLGAAILQFLHVNPKGAPNESQQFEHLWIAALIQAVAPMLTLVALPWMIPNALQTEKLLDADAKAVDNSPWQRLMRRRTSSQYGSFA